MTLSLRLNNEDVELFKAYAAMHGISVSELLRRSALERIEDEFDLKEYESAIKEYKNNPVSYPLEDVIKELNLD